MLDGWMEWMDSGYPSHCYDYLSTCGAKRPSFSWLPYSIDGCPYDYTNYVMQLLSYRSQKYSNDKERDREWSGWHQVTEGGQSLPRPHLPSFVQNINRGTWKKHQRNIWNCQQTILPIRDIFEIVNRQSYPALYKTSTEKHDKNIRKIFEIVNRQTRCEILIFSVFLTKAMSVSSVSHFTFSGTFYLWKFAKLTNRPERPLLLIYLVHFHQDEILFTRSRFLPIYSGTEKHANLTNILVLALSDWCYGSHSNTIQRIFFQGGYPPPSADNLFAWSGETMGTPLPPLQKVRIQDI